ncbi:hypothetical protein [Roseateles amylovorans]|uniref:DoxX n=1 Tax=Roseateles amylovorans TaxID=2978473 RepID=A0ABY6AVF7_9BURK|nr:hypothetical protein [Roseateles amylovorans]UXH76780.1 hypothetical protein N4261_17295 [Roseateles amylovorans]
MQTLFSCFPTGLPGIALLLMRVALCMLVAEVTGWPSDPLNRGAMAVIAWAASAALVIGFLTPVIAILCVLVVGRAWLLMPPAVDLMQICLVLEAVALALLGPGAYSLDARCFGRRRIVFARDDETDAP